MTAVYVITRFLTLPGAYLRGFFEHLICRKCGLLVESSAYLRSDEACSHVEHSFPKTSGKAALAAMLPGTVNFILGCVLLLSGLLPLTLLKVRPFESGVMFGIYIALVYLGGSMLCNIFPLVEDALNCRELLCSAEEAKTVNKILFTVPCAVNTAGAFAEKYCITFLTTAALILLAFLFI